MTDIETIAKGLSDVQKYSVKHTRGPDEDGLCWFALGSARDVPLELKQRTVVGHCLTPLGQAVRDYLKGEK